MFNFKKKSAPKKRAVFTVNIDLNRKYTERFGHKNDKDECRLTSNQSYYFGQKEENVTYENIKEFSLNVIERELQEELQELIDIPIYSIRINKTYEGSIEIIFSVLFNVYQFIAGIKDFFDSLRLIRDTTEKHLNKRLKERYGDYFSVNTTISSPSTDSYRFDDMDYLIKKGKPIFIPNNQNSKRDAFFYYLLISNVILISIVIFLVWKAVKETYQF